MDCTDANMQLIYNWSCYCSIVLMGSIVSLSFISTRGINKVIRILILKFQPSPRLSPSVNPPVIEAVLVTKPLMIAALTIPVTHAAIHLSHLTRHWSPPTSPPVSPPSCTVCWIMNN